MITIERHKGVNVVRDDLLTGGTKSILMPSIIGSDSEYVYASPVYGGFQIALSAYCQSVGKRATIFCAKRNSKHANTLTCIRYGAKVVEVPCGYLTVVEKHAKDYCTRTGAKKLVFGASSPENKRIIANRVQDAISQLGREPYEIWCAIGTGTLVESILMATTTAKVYGVQVGAEYTGKHPRLKVLKYPRPFEYESKFACGFPSMPNYDRKAFEICAKNKVSDSALFWNVL